MANTAKSIRQGLLQELSELLVLCVPKNLAESVIETLLFSLHIAQHLLMVIFYVFFAKNRMSAGITFGIKVLPDVVDCKHITITH